MWIHCLCKGTPAESMRWHIHTCHAWHIASVQWLSSLCSLFPSWVLPTFPAGRALIWHHLHLSSNPSPDTSGLCNHLRQDSLSLAPTLSFPGCIVRLKIKIPTHLPGLSLRKKGHEETDTYCVLFGEHKSSLFLPPVPHTLWGLRIWEGLPCFTPKACHEQQSRQEARFFCWRVSGRVWGVGGQGHGERTN